MLGRRDHDERIRAERSHRFDHPVHESAPQQRVKVFGKV
jgi:hypothetical protein